MRFNFDTPTFIYIVAALLATFHLSGSTRKRVEAQVELRDQKETVDEAIAKAFRIDILSIEVDYDLNPKLDLVSGQATIVFLMRPKQRQALIHFDPLKNNSATSFVIDEIELNGEVLDCSDSKDVRRRVVGSSPERAYEFQRDLSQDKKHILKMRWKIWGRLSQGHPGWLISDVDDTIGLGNETLWPTINAPHELAKHTIRFSLPHPKNVVVVGSGTLSTEESEDQVMSHVLRSGQEIASYTMLVAVIPRNEARRNSFQVGETAVTLVSTQTTKENARARSIIEATIPRLENDFGPFPMKRLCVIMIDWEDGMEYFGGTITGVDSLEHEIAHMYFGCSLVLKTWRDTWVDEALVVWWLEREELDDLPEDFESDIVAGRSPTDLAFDQDAYEEGAMIFKEVAKRLGGDKILLTFLRDLHRRRKFAPFTTLDLVGDLVRARKKEPWRMMFDAWVESD